MASFATLRRRHLTKLSATLGCEHGALAADELANSQIEQQLQAELDRLAPRPSATDAHGSRPQLCCCDHVGDADVEGIELRC